MLALLTYLVQAQVQQLHALVARQRELQAAIPPPGAVEAAAAPEAEAGQRHECAEYQPVQAAQESMPYEPEPCVAALHRPRARRHTELLSSLVGELISL